MFGCPYNFYPEKPWLRRTIRGVIATGVVVASPVIVVGAVTAAITVLPPFGIYKLVHKIRSRRHAQTYHEFPVGEPFLIEPDLDVPQTFGGPPGLLFDMNRYDLRRHTVTLSFAQTLDEDDDDDDDEDEEQNSKEINIDFPLSIFAEMDVEHLFSDNDDDELNSSPSDFRTCPTTPATNIRKGRSQSLSQLTTNYHSSINRHHSITPEY